MSDRIQLLDDLGAELGRVAAEAERPLARRGPRRRFARAGHRARVAAVGVGVVLLLAGGAYSVPIARSAFDGVFASLGGWVSGTGGDAPGREVRPEDGLRHWWLDGEGEARLIAEAEGVGLYVRRSDAPGGPWLEFGLGDDVSVSMGARLEDWSEFLGRDGIVLLGPAMLGRGNQLDDRGRYPLLGLTLPEIKRLEFRYAEGRPLRGRTGDGGFVLLVDAWRPPLELIGYDSDGHIVERLDVTDRDMSYVCAKEPGDCPR
ncbi:MAG: hypothetical protein GXY03_14140 [Solirubrobacterales bacterium]|nr:hypothetical protein [Solirubrobacterales bacterium]